MNKKHSTVSNFSSKNKKKSNNKLKKILVNDNVLNFGKAELKRSVGLSLSEDLYIFLKKKSKEENISVSAIISRLVMLFASSEGKEIEVGNVRKLKQKKPD